MRRRKFINRSLKYVVSALLCCLANAAYGLPVIDKPFTPQRDASEMANALNQFIPLAMQQARVPGLSIAIIRDGEVIYKQAFGLNNYWGERPITTDTIFEVASFSKPVTAYGVLHLAEKGVIDLDEPVTRYLPEAPAGVTLRQALAHSSALTHVRPDGYAAGGTPGESFAYSAAGYLLAGDLVEHLSNQSLADYLTAQVLMPLGMAQSGYGDYPADKTRLATPHASTNFPVMFVFIFGFAISVSLVLIIGIGRWVIGLIRKSPFRKSSHWWKLCIVIGFSLAVLSLFYFFNTANAKHYAIVVIPIFTALLLSLVLLTAKNNPQKAQNKGNLGNRRVRVVLGLFLLVFSILAIWQSYPVPLDYRQPDHASYAGLRSTASDMALFLDELMAPTLIDETLVQDMLKPQIEANSYNAWGLGIGIQTNSKQKNIWHWGVNYPGYQALMIGYPEHRLGIVVLMNGGPMAYRTDGLSTGGLELARMIVAEAIGGEHHDYWKDLP